nr:RepA1 [Escherichia coli]
MTGESLNTTGGLSSHRNIVADAFALLSCPTPETGKSKFSPLPAFP